MEQYADYYAGVSILNAPTLKFKEVLTQDELLFLIEDLKNLEKILKLNKTQESLKNLKELLQAYYGVYHFRKSGLENSFRSIVHFKKTLLEGIESLFDFLLSYKKFSSDEEINTTAIIRNDVLSVFNSIKTYNSSLQLIKDDVEEIGLDKLFLKYMNAPELHEIQKEDYQGKYLELCEFEPYAKYKISERLLPNYIEGHYGRFITYSLDRDFLCVVEGSEFFEFSEEKESTYAKIHKDLYPDLYI